jgi:Winged helix-turn helix
MPSAVRLREDYSAKELRALARRSKDVNQSRRLLSLAAVRDGMDRGGAAKIGGMDSQTLRDWVHRFNASGPQGLIDNGTEGPKPRLSEQQLTQFAQIVEAGPGLSPGFRLDADHPENGVLIPCRFTRNVQAQRRRAAGLHHRRSRQARQSLACLEHRRAHAVGTGEGVRTRSPRRLTRSVNSPKPWDVSDAYGGRSFRSAGQNQIGIRGRLGMRILSRCQDARKAP